VSIDPRQLRPSMLTRMLNSTPLGEVISERQLRRHRNGAGYRIGDEKRVDLFRYGAAVEAIAADQRGELVAWVEQMSQTISYRPQTFRLRCVDVRTGASQLDLEVPLVEPQVQRIGDLAISPDRKTIAFGGSQGEPAVGVVDIEKGAVLWNTAVPMPRGGVWMLAFCPDSRSFYATDNCGQLTRYETRTGRILWQTGVAVPALTPWGDQAMERLLAVDVSPDGAHVAVGTDYTCKVIVWEVSSGKLVGEIQVSKWPIESVLVFSHDGKGIWAAGSQDRSIRYFPIP